MQELLDFEQERFADRVFLGWDVPLLESVKHWLLADARRDVLASTMVVVPTSNSGRRLRMALSEGGGVISPHVVVPNRLFEVQGVASKQESLWAWLRVIQTAELRQFPYLFPNHDVDGKVGFHEALALAKQFVQLREELADGNASFRDASYYSVEKERWDELNELESMMLKQLGKWKLRDPILAKRDQVLAPELPSGVERIVVACVPDPTPMAIRALKSLLTQGLPIEILIHAPSQEKEGFDSWGLPCVDYWTKRSIQIPDWRQRLHVVDTASDAAQSCVRILSDQNTTAEHVALALCDPSFESSLEKTFSEHGWPLYHPDGRSLAESGLVGLLRAMRDLVGKDGSFEALRDLVRLPGAELFLPEQVSRYQAAELMDALHIEHLPETVRDARFLAASDEREILQSIASHIDLLSDQTEAKKMVALLRRWLSEWLVYCDQKVAKAIESGLVEAIDALDRLAAHTEEIAPDEAFEMLTESVKSARIPSERGDTVLDLQGWLEISYDPAEHLILAGMHEECVPEGTGDDAFLPDSLRDQLGLRDMRARFARDAFILQAALCSRAQNGRVDAVVSRFNQSGESRKPSRLLMRQSGQELAALVCHLFDESASQPRKRGAWRRDWQLEVPIHANRYTGEDAINISPSAIKDYLNCPFRFYLKRIAKMKTYDANKREMDALDFGKLCHHVLDEFGADEAMRDSSDVTELEGYFMARLDVAMEQLFGKNLSLPLIVQLESARERLRAFAKIQAADRAMGWCIVETEYQIGKYGDNWQIANHPVTMAIDRIDRHEDGNQWRVWDYKTSGKAKHPKEAHLRRWREQENRPQLGDLWDPSGKPFGWADVQLPMYAAFTQQRFETGELPQVGYINLPRAISDAAFTAWAPFEESHVEHAMSWAEAAVESIRAGDFTQIAQYPANQRDWDDFAELAPDGLEHAYKWSEVATSTK
ncbi:MAG: PD-(D/E)XK nuclease family protein [Akkermansiaceae bacterium]